MPGVGQRDMAFTEKLKEALLGRISEGVAAAIIALILWAGYELTPALLPAIESVISKRVLLALFISSLLLNIVLAIVIWATKKKGKFILKYGIYWDKNKNPYCPSCKTPLAAYGRYTLGLGYYCRACRKEFPLADSTGKDVNPADAIKEL